MHIPHTGIKLISIKVLSSKYTAFTGEDVISFHGVCKTAKQGTIGKRMELPVGPG